MATHKAETGGGEKRRIYIYCTEILDARSGSEGLGKSQKVEEYGASTNRDDAWKSQKNEDEYFQLARRFGRYKRMRGASLKNIREERSQNKQQEDYVPWGEIHDRVNKMKDETGYKSEDEEKNTGTERVCRRKNGLGNIVGKGKKGKHGKRHHIPEKDPPNQRRSY